MKKNLIIGISILAVISFFSVVLFFCFFFDRNSDIPILTGDKEELKSITVMICDKEGNTEKPVILTDQAYMYSIYDHLSSISTVIHKGAPPMEGSTKILLTYSYAYDGESAKQDVVFWGTDNSFYRCEDDSYMLGKNAALHELLTGLFENVELEMVSEDQPLPRKMTIHEYRGSNVINMVSLEDTNTIYFVFSNLQAIQTRAILYPSELSALALDIEYELILEYEDQENIVIFNGTETPDTFYRYSKTASSSGEEGYVFGENQALYEFIATLFGNHQPDNTV